MQDDHTFFVCAHDILTMEVRIALQGMIDTRLKFAGRDLCNGHKAPMAELEKSGWVVGADRVRYHTLLAISNAKHLKL